MMRSLAALAALAALAFAGVAGADSGVRRIVSLAPHLTEIAFAAGAGDRLVGTVAYSDWPPEALALPRIGDAFRLDYEAVLGLRPDLVLAWTSGTPAEARARLRSLGLDVAELDADDPDGIARQVERVGALAGTEPAARAMAADLRGRLTALRRDYAGRAPVRVFYLVAPKPLLTVSRRHVIGQAIELCGGENVFAELPALVPSVSVESVLAAAPDLVVVAGHQASAALAEWRRWPELPAARDGNLAAIDPDLVSRPGVRFVDGVAALCRVIEGARGRRAP